MGKGLVLVIMLWGVGNPSWAVPPRLPAFPPLQWTPPKAERVVLPNGMIVFLLEDHELPLIEVTARIRTGTIYDPPERIGLASLFGPALRSGGTTHHSPDQINTTLESVGSSIEVSIDLESGSAALSSLTDHFETTLALFAELLMAPRFQQSQVSLQKQHLLEAIRRRNDDPGEVTRREFRALVYGKEHPYGRYPEAATVRRIRRRDLVAFHHRYLVPNNLMLAVTGDFETKGMLKILERAFQGWALRPVIFPSVPPVVHASVPGTVTPTPPSGLSIHYMKKDVNQTQIRMGHLGIPRHHPAHFALEALNEILGGSATSRLFREIRSRQGLAYAVGSAFSEPTDLGLIVVVCQTKASSTVHTIEEIRRIIRALQQAPISPRELAIAKETIINSFVFHFTSSAQIATQQMDLEYFGFPPDYLATYPQRIAAITAEDVQQAARQLLHPDQAALLVVGNAAAFDHPLTVLGPVYEISVK